MPVLILDFLLITFYLVLYFRMKIKSYSFFSLYLCVSIFWTLFIYIVPPYWIGYSDGYMYSMFIHESRYGLPFGDYSHATVSSYPSYFFTLIGIFFRIFPESIIPTGVLYALTFPIAIILGITTLYIANHKLGRSAEASATYATLPILLLYISNDHWYAEKPHEILMVYLSCALLTYISNAKVIERGVGKSIGITLGLLLGIFPPGTFIFGVIVFISHKISKETKFLIFRIAIFIGAPYLGMFLYNSLKYKGIYKSFFTGYEFRFEYLALTIPHLLLLFGIILLFFLSGREIAKLNLVIYLCILLMNISASVLMRHDFIVQSLDWMFILSGLTTAYSIILEITQKFNFSINWAHALVPLALLIATFAWSTNPSNPIALNSIIFSNTRSANLLDLSTYTKNQKFREPLIYLANDESQFLAYELPLQARPLLFFNESYAPFSKQQITIYELQDSIKNSEFSEFLISRGVCLVALKWNSETADFNITANTNYLGSDDVNQIALSFSLTRGDVSSLKNDWLQTIYPSGLEVWARKSCLG